MSSLKAILKRLLSQAGNLPGTPIRKKLPNGLRVDVLLKNGHTHLQLVRGETYPSHHEWQTVLKHWPYPMDLNTPYKELKGYNKKYLQGSWPTPSIPQQPELVPGNEKPRP